MTRTGKNFLEEPTRCLRDSVIHRHGGRFWHLSANRLDPLMDSLSPLAEAMNVSLVAIFVEDRHRLRYQLARAFGLSPNGECPDFREMIRAFLKIVWADRRSRLSPDTRLCTRSAVLCTCVVRAHGAVTDVRSADGALLSSEESDSRLYPDMSRWPSRTVCSIRNSKSALRN